MRHNRVFSGEEDEDGFTIHYARASRDHNRLLSASKRRSSARRSSTRHSMLSVTSGAMAQRSFLLPEGGIGSSVFNLCSATLGAGVLALPRCAAYSGSFLAPLFVFLSGTASCYAIVVLVMVSSRTGYMSYEEMSLKLLGKRWVYVSVVLIALLCFGTAVGYIIAIGDILDPFRELSGSPSFLKGQGGRYISQIGWWLCFFLPASLPKHVNALRFASFVGVVAIAFLIVVLLIKAVDKTDHPSTDVVRGGADTLFSLPVIMFGYGCQVNTFEIYREMYQPSVRRMSIAAGIALALCSSFYIFAGVIGYVAFGEKVHGNVLKDLDPTSDALATIAFIGVSVTVTMAFPLCVFPTRDALQFLIWPPAETSADGEGDSAGEEEDVPSGGAEDAPLTGGYDHNAGPMTTPLRMNLVLIICLGILVCGLFIPKITTVFGIIGGLCIGAIGYSIPALFALRCEFWTPNNVGMLNVVATYALFVFGIITATVGTGISVYHIVAVGV